MVTDYHKAIERALNDVGKEWKETKAIKQVLRGCEHPLSIVDPRTKYVLNYQPDAYYLLKNNKKLIFEVLDSEADKQDIIVADIIRSFLVDNVEGLIFLHPGPDVVETTVLEALKTIYKGLVYKGVPTKELPNDKKTGPYMVTKDEAKDQAITKQKICQYADENHWLTSTKRVNK